MASTIAYAASQSGSDPIDAFLAQLKDPEPEVRIAALRELQTSLDPRIPKAMLPLLSDEGNSIRRIAARAIGSRWWQIPKDEVRTYVSALHRNDSTEFPDEKNMIDRAVGLLTRNYDGGMFVRSANKRWVIYERRALPCLIDTQTDSEELLGWPLRDSGSKEPHPLEWQADSLPGEFFLAGNGTLGRFVSWHPTKEVVAFQLKTGRNTFTIWIWRHGAGLRKLHPVAVLRALGEKKRFGADDDVPFLDIEITDWTPQELRFKSTYAPYIGEGAPTYTGDLALGITDGKLRLISLTTER